MCFWRPSFLVPSLPPRPGWCRDAHPLIKTSPELNRPVGRRNLSSDHNADRPTPGARYRGARRRAAGSAACSGARHRQSQREPIARTTNDCTRHMLALLVSSPTQHSHTLLSQEVQSLQAFTAYRLRTLSLSLNGPTYAQDRGRALSPARQPPPPRLHRRCSAPCALAWTTPCTPRTHPPHLAARLVQLTPRRRHHGGRARFARVCRRPQVA